MAKVTLSYYESEHNHVTVEWDLPWFDIWPFRRLIEDKIKLMEFERAAAKERA